MKPLITFILSTITIFNTTNFIDLLMNIMGYPKTMSIVLFFLIDMLMI